MSIQRRGFCASVLRAVFAPLGWLTGKEKPPVTIGAVPEGEDVLWFTTGDVDLYCAGPVADDYDVDYIRYIGLQCTGEYWADIRFRPLRCGPEVTACHAARECIPGEWVIRNAYRQDGKGRFRLPVKAEECPAHRDIWQIAWETGDVTTFAEGMIA